MVELTNMPHTPETRKRALEKMKKARADWIAANGPCKQCGSTERLEVDHVDPDQKVSHAVWSWAFWKRFNELAKCQVLCHECHKKKTAARLSQMSTGAVRLKLRKLTDKDVLKAVLMRKSGVSVRKIAAKFGVTHPTISTLTRAVMDGKQFHSRGVLLGKDLK